MPLRIHNTLSRALEPFHPIEAGHVRMYVCGITVYDACHMGHARFLLAFDTVARWLKASGLAVTHVRNITDIEDKIIRRAQERGITIAALTDEMIGSMHADTAALGIEPPTHEPRATDHVPQMLAMIGTLESKGYAYRASNGDVNYSVRRFAGYGKLSGRSLDDLRAGERVAVDDAKQDPLDFVLWKAAKAEEPDAAKWPSDYGPGRPGWHIECSAMCKALLGDRFDIHGGGQDLQFPHHENEIAQSEAANGGPFADVWMHNGLLNVDDAKMSKSLGNFFTIHEVLERFDGESIRFSMLRTHYRKPFNFTDGGIAEARAALRRLYTALDAAGFDAPGEATVAHDWSDPRAAAFRDAMDEDFNTPLAVATLFELAGDANRGDATAAPLLRRLGHALGVLQQRPRDFLQGGPAEEDGAAAIEARIAERAAAKKARDFARADAIRDALARDGVVLQDSAAGTTWVRV
jgi:cysteinyl-tRNA synthetase